MQQLECDAKACGRNLCGQERWNCADCLGLFCEQHTVDLLDEDQDLLEARELKDAASVYVCVACRLRRMKIGPQIAAANRKEEYA
jgi:hypothetical protein